MSSHRLDILRSSPAERRAPGQILNGSGGPVRSVLILSLEAEGGQPIDAARAAGALKQNGYTVTLVDVNRQSTSGLPNLKYDAVVFVLPDLPSLKKVGRLIAEARLKHPDAAVVCYGRHAKLFARELTARYEGVVVVVPSGPRHLFQDEDELLARLGSSECGSRRIVHVPDRNDLPAPDQYGLAQLPDGSQAAQGNLEFSRGCHHKCEYCSEPAYGDGQVRLAEIAAVRADALQQWNCGATHFYFVDADFFNSKKPALELLRQLHEDLPSATFEIVTRADHLLELGADGLAQLRALGVVRATASLEFPSDRMLQKISKGFEVAVLENAFLACKAAGIEMKATWIPFNPWVSFREVAYDFPKFLDRTGLGAATPVANRFTRLYLYNQSLLLKKPEVLKACGEAGEWHTEWRHPDGLVDELWARIPAVQGRCCPRC